MAAPQAGITAEKIFPGVVGVIDGIHVRIVAPRKQKEVYVSRKLQLVFDYHGGRLSA